MTKLFVARCGIRTQTSTKTVKLVKFMPKEKILPAKPAEWFQIPA